MAACLTVLLSGCGFFQSPADGIDFRPPNGWHGTPGIQGKYQLWVSHDGGEALFLAKLPAAGTSIDRMYRVTQATPFRLQTAGKAYTVTVLEHRNLTLCGRQRSAYVKEVSVSKRNRTAFLSEYVASHAGRFDYLTMYARPVASPPEPAAEAALYQLCPVPG
jgi:hypothetical protein